MRVVEGVGSCARVVAMACSLVFACLWQLSAHSTNKVMKCWCCKTLPCVFPLRLCVAGVRRLSADLVLSLPVCGRLVFRCG